MQWTNKWMNEWICDGDGVYRESTEAAARRSARTRSWPSSYIDPPLLIVADNEVCNAAICTAPSAVNNGRVANSATDDNVFVDTDPVAASADQLQVTASQDTPPSTDHPPPLRTQRSDPGPTSRTILYDHSATPRPLTADPDIGEAPPPWLSCRQAEETVHRFQSRHVMAQFLPLGNIQVLIHRCRPCWYTTNHSDCCCRCYCCCWWWWILVNLCQRSSL